MLSFLRKKDQGGLPRFFRFVANRTLTEDPEQFEILRGSTARRGGIVAWVAPRQHSGSAIYDNREGVFLFRSDFVGQLEAGGIRAERWVTCRVIGPDEAFRAIFGAAADKLPRISR